MRIAGFAVSLFGTAFLVHWLLWRIRLPRRQTLTLLGIFLSALPLAALMALYVPEWGFWPRNFWEWLHVATFHVAVSLAYIVTYSVLEETSPTLTIVAFVVSAGAAGRSVKEAATAIDNSSILCSRLQAMVRDGMLIEENAVYRLTPKGRAWAQVFSTARDLLSMNKGG